MIITEKMKKSQDNNSMIHTPFIDYLDSKNSYNINSIECLQIIKQNQYSSRVHD